MHIENELKPAGARAHRRVVLLSALLACGCAAFAQGCYERVVGAKGFGADQYEVAEPYQETGQVDDWIFGPQNTIQKRRGSMMR